MMTMMIMLTLTIILIGPNFRLYLLFVFLLTWFIFANYGGQSQRDVIEATFSQLYIAVFLLLLVSIARDWWKDVKVGSQMFLEFLISPVQESVRSDNLAKDTIKGKLDTSSPKLLLQLVNSWSDSHLSIKMFYRLPPIGRTSFFALVLLFCSFPPVSNPPSLCCLVFSSSGSTSPSSVKDSNETGLPTWKGLQKTNCLQGARPVGRLSEALHLELGERLGDADDRPCYLDPDTEH